MAALDVYWVEHRDDPHGGWDRHEPLPVCWTDAVHQLRHAAEAALAGTDDDDLDDVSQECQEFLQVIDKGLLAEVPSPASTYTGRFLRIVPAGPVLRDPIAAELRWWVIHNADGLAAVTITTYAGQAIDGTLAWEDVEPHAVSLTVSGRTTVLRLERIESFTLDPHRHPTGHAP